MTNSTDLVSANDSGSFLLVNHALTQIDLPYEANVPVFAVETETAENKSK